MVHRRGSVTVLRTNVIMKTEGVFLKRFKASSPFFLALAALAFASSTAPGAVVEAWIQRYNGPANNHDEARAVAVDGHGNVVVTGKSSNGTNVDIYTTKYAAGNGAVTWERRYNPEAGNDFPATIAVDGHGDVVVAGSASGAAYTAKYAALDGVLIWEQHHAGNPGSRARALVIDVNNDVVIAGESYTTTNGYADYYTAKYAGAGRTLLWERRYDGPAARDDNAAAVGVDSEGNVFVTGFSADGGPYWGSAVYTAKYAAANGALMWEHRYGNRTNRNDSGLALAVTPEGDLAVTSYCYDRVAGHVDYLTLKYAGATGALMWEQRYNGSGNGDDLAEAVAVDRSGNVIVTGAVGPRGNFDYYTAKYAAAEGTVLWEKRYNGPANGDDYAQAVAVDENDNVVVTGTSRTGEDGNDYYTAKYAAADGALLWERRYNGPASTNDVVPTSRCLALGRNGVVAVTGTSVRESENVDYATVVYWEHLPAVEIELVRDGVRIRFKGSPGETYAVQRANVVTGPWSTLATRSAADDGMVEYIDTDGSNGAVFYRVAAR
jgi:hypothetical protein